MISYQSQARRPRVWLPMFWAQPLARISHPSPAHCEGSPAGEKPQGPEGRLGSRAPGRIGSPGKVPPLLCSLRCLVRKQTLRCPWATLKAPLCSLGLSVLQLLQPRHTPRGRNPRPWELCGGSRVLLSWSPPTQRGLRSWRQTSPLPSKGLRPSWGQTWLQRKRNWGLTSLSNPIQLFGVSCGNSPRTRLHLGTSPRGSVSKGWHA